ncbi:MAG: RNA 2',3'-cyclic phosphodiesterase [Opitutaceae bacterium]|nr:RNA 2',3'-cyclic phosphodiesterase [Opitutaceae bacterium]
MPRLFLALALPDALRSALAALQTPVAHGVNWATPAQLHLTLRFIGEVHESCLAALEDSLASVRVASFILPLEGVGAFPPRGQPQVLWAGVGHAHPHLFQLRQQLDDRLLALGFDADLKTFHPHATLARLHRDASPGFAAEWLRRHRAWEGPPFLTTSFGLYASQLTPTGAIHTRLREYSLA